MGKSLLYMYLMKVRREYFPIGMGLHLTRRVIIIQKRQYAFFFLSEMEQSKSIGEIVI